MTMAATKTNTAVLSVFVLLSITFIFLTIGDWGAGHTDHDQHRRLDWARHGGCCVVRLGGRRNQRHSRKGRATGWSAG